MGQSAFGGLSSGEGVVQPQLDMKEVVLDDGLDTYTKKAAAFLREVMALAKEQRAGSRGCCASCAQ